MSNFRSNSSLPLSLLVIALLVYSFGNWDHHVGKLIRNDLNLICHAN